MKATGCETFNLLSMQPVALHLRHLPVSELLMRGGKILSSLRRHPDVFTDLPVSLDYLEQILTDLSLAEQQMSARNYSVRSKRDNLVAELKLKLNVLASRVAIIANDDVGIYLMAGMDLKRPSVRSAAVPPVSIKWLKTGMMEGTVNLMVKKERIHHALQVQLSYDITEPDNWQDCAFTSTSRIMLRNLTSFSEVWVRVRGLCTAQRMTDWTPPMMVKVM